MLLLSLSLLMVLSEELERIRREAIPLKDIWLWMRDYALAMLPTLCIASMLSATFLTYRSLEKNRHLLAARAMGISLPSLSQPLYYLALLVGIFSFYLQAYARPLALERLDGGVYFKPQEASEGSSARGLILLEDTKGRKWMLGSYQAQRRRGQNIFIWQGGEQDPRLSWAREGTWDPLYETWQLKDFHTLDLQGSDPNAWAEKPLKEKTLHSPSLGPQTASAHHRALGLLTWGELRQLRTTLSAQNPKHRLVRAALLGQLATALNPLACLLFVLTFYRYKSEGISPFKKHCVTAVFLCLFAAPPLLKIAAREVELASFLIGLPACLAVLFGCFILYKHG